MWSVKKPDLRREVRAPAIVVSEPGRGSGAGVGARASRSPEARGRVCSQSYCEVGQALAPKIASSHVSSSAPNGVVPTCNHRFLISSWAPQKTCTRGPGTLTQTSLSATPGCRRHLPAARDRGRGRSPLLGVTCIPAPSTGPHHTRPRRARRRDKGRYRRTSRADPRMSTAPQRGHIRVMRPPVVAVAPPRRRADVQSQRGSRLRPPNRRDHVGTREGHEAARNRELGQPTHLKCAKAPARARARLHHRCREDERRRQQEERDGTRDSPSTETQRATDDEFKNRRKLYRNSVPQRPLAGGRVRSGQLEQS